MTSNTTDLLIKKNNNHSFLISVIENNAIKTECLRLKLTDKSYSVEMHTEMDSNSNKASEYTHKEILGQNHHIINLKKYTPDFYLDIFSPYGH